MRIENELPIKIIIETIKSVANNDWEKIELVCPISDNNLSGIEANQLVNNNLEQLQLGWKAFDLIAPSLYLRKSIFESSNSKRIWGFNLTLYSNNTFNIEYDYEKPEWYEEDPSFDFKNEIKKEISLDMDDSSQNFEQHREIVDIESVYQSCREELILKTSLASQAWDMDKIDQWDIDLVMGLISFTIGERIEVFEINVVGTYHVAEQTFMWAWDHPSIPEDLQEVASMVKDYGEEHDIVELQEHIVSCSEDDAWNFTALATHLAEQMALIEQSLMGR